MLKTFLTDNWQPSFPETLQHDAINHLESGQIIHFPKLGFELSPEETLFLSADFSDPHAKNISYQSDCNKLWGVQHLSDDQHVQLKNMLHRFNERATHFIKQLFPQYAASLMVARTSYRPVQICNRKTSCRKDDKRLHVDAFPSAPNQGKRILRVFTNINPHGESRVWRVGEPFETVAATFLPRCKKPLPGFAALLRFLKITKSYRTAYDHYMLQIHDRMKADDAYQQQAQQQEIHFPPASTWVTQTDDVSHAAMSGQYMLEQTFYLPVKAMQNEAQSPLRILEKHLKRPLISR